ncbi:thiamine-phosphate kinase, partial [Stenotrophomonas pictorum]
MSLDEFGLIERIAARTRARADIALGIGDDAALLQLPPGQQLVVTADTLNAGVHFPPETLPADIGWKALAVNLSDLAAMGAQPAWCTLALSLPEADPDWIEAFADGFFALADAHGIALIGGDTTRGPLSISITAMGWVPAGQALRRDAARVGDDVWVSGHPGEAA